MEPDEGTYKWGVTTSQSYFPKDNTELFNRDETIVDWLMPFSPEKDPTYVRGFLGRMLFPGEDGIKKVNVLSGGEPVSYTHLDVYKRQDKHCSLHICQNTDNNADNNDNAGKCIIL